MYKEKNITQTDMAGFLGESQQYVNLLIRNKVFPRRKRLKKFARITNTDVAFWVTSTGKQKEQAIKKAIQKIKAAS